MTYNLQPSYPTVSDLTTNDKALTVLYGRLGTDGTLLPINIDALGNIQIGTDITLNVSEITPVNCVQPDGSLLNTTTNLSLVGGQSLSLGQKTSALSLPVVISSDQPPIPVTFPGSIVVSQTTAADLNATVVGTVTANAGTGSFTVAQSVAANLNATVSGTVTSNIGTTNGLALDSSLQSILTDTNKLTFSSTRLLVDNSQVTQPTNLTAVGGSPVTIGQKTSAQSVPVVLASDQTITVGSITAGTIDVTVPPQIQTGTITTAGNYVQLEMDGRQGVAVLTVGTWDGVLIAQASSDNAATWQTVSLLSVIPGGPAISADQISGNNLYHITQLDGITHVRIYAVSIASGTANVTLTGTAAPSRVTNSIVSLDQNSPTVAGFSRLRVANPYSLFDSQHTLDSQPLLWESNLIAGGTATFLPNEAAMLLTAGSTSGSSSQRRSKERFRYQAGRSQQILSTGVLGTAQANVTQKIGYYDDLNGVYFQQTSTGLAVVLRTSTSGSTTETVVPQSAWNVDTFDGKGPSGIAIDPTKSNIFFMELEWLGVGAVRMGFSVNGVLYLCHIFDNTNVIDTVYMGTGSLPCTYEIFTTGAIVGTASMKQICTSVLSEGGQPLTPLYFTVGTGITPVQAKADAAYAVILFRPSLAYNGEINRAQFYPYAADLLTTGAEPVFVQAILNPTIVGSPVWTPYNTSISGAEYSTTSGVTVTGGIPAFSTFIEPRKVSHQEIPGNTLPITLNSAGTSQDVVAFVATSLSDVSPVYGTISWKEFH